MITCDSTNPTGRIDTPKRNRKDPNIVNIVNHQTIKMNKKKRTKVFKRGKSQ